MVLGDIQTVPYFGCFVTLYVTDVVIVSPKYAP